jgi:hypothetical protein
MAISVDTVYKTVLLILNKEQRGYMTPEEFNKVGTQVQLEIFEKYFEDLNQLTRVPQNDMDYADRVAYLDQKISLFKNYGESVTPTSNGIAAFPTNLHVLGTVTMNEIEVQRVSRNEYYNLKKSPITKPTLSYPVYLLENNSIQLDPFSGESNNAIQNILFDYISKPASPEWNYSVGSVGQFIFNAVNLPTNPSVDFGLHSSEQVELVLRILAYAGIIIRDPNIVQAATSQVQQTNINEKS